MNPILLIIYLVVAAFIFGGAINTILNEGSFSIGDAIKAFIISALWPMTIPMAILISFMLG